MSTLRHDVAIIGAGIAGLAAAVWLRKAGMRVVCLDPRRYPQSKVGESLDWSSPGLLRRLGIDTDALIADRVATYKKNIVVCEIGKAEWRATPPPMIRRSPLRFETLTLHVDRTALDARLFAHASALGTEFIWERVTAVHADSDRVTGYSTADGQRVEARWYIDASGTARVLSRALGIPTVAYGLPKVCLWTYFDTAPLYDGTAFLSITATSISAGSGTFRYLRIGPASGSCSRRKPYAIVGVRVVPSTPSFALSCHATLGSAACSTPSRPSRSRAPPFSRT